MPSSSASTKSYTVIGTPFSTFTRTITLGLHYKGIPFDQTKVLPHSDEARAAHPYGYLPTLLIRDPSGRVTKLSESQAIARYIDRVAPEPSLHFVPDPQDGDDGGVLEERMWEVVSLVASFGFPIIERGLVKPVLKALEAGQSKPEGKDGLSKITEFLNLITDRRLPNTKFLFSNDHPTWADFYLYPPLADLQVLTDEWKQAVANANGPGGGWDKWMDAMGELDEVKRTVDGTLASQR